MKIKRDKFALIQSFLDCLTLLEVIRFPLLSFVFNKTSMELRTESHGKMITGLVATQGETICTKPKPSLEIENLYWSDKYFQPEKGYFKLPVKKP
jgi:hypothetical protein